MLRLILFGAVAASCAMWQLMSFWVDDAFISFRYVAQARAGFGYVWNAPPFAPVEGYTSPAWLWLLRVIWAATGLQPPEVAQWLGLGFGLAMIWLCWRFIAERALPVQWQRWRAVIAAILLTGLVSNRTFVTWLSGGMETALFNFMTLWWALNLAAKKNARAVAIAVATALVRPEGMIFVTATVALVGFEMLRDRRPLLALARVLAPLLVLVTHLLWRHAFYGEWLPNTYYAKIVRAWPEAGTKYTGSFVLEYGWWILLPLVAVALKRRPRIALAHVAIAGALLAYVGYFTIVVGGDHFEFRPFSLLVPFVMIGTWLLVERVFTSARWGLVFFALVVLNALPIPWTHFRNAQAFVDGFEAERNRKPDPEAVPWPWRPIAKQWSTWQGELTSQLICLRQHEHRLLLKHVTNDTLHIDEGDALRWDGHTIFLGYAAGFAAWRDMRSATLDFYGLSDWVIARLPSYWRYMAHEHRAPDAYLACYGLSHQFPRTELAPERVIECEKTWRARVAELRANAR